MKNAFQAYVTGIKRSKFFFRPVLFIYFVNLLLGLTVALPFSGRLQSEFAHSILSDAFRQGFDFTAFAEIMRQSSQILASFLAQAWWIILLYLLLSIFFTGGILTALKRYNEKPTLGVLFDGGLLTFFRFLKLFVYTGICHALAALVVYLPLTMILKMAYERVVSEASLFYIVLAAVFIHLLLVGMMLLVSVYAKIRLVQEDSRKVFRGLLKAFGFVFRRFLVTVPLFVMLGINAILFAILYWFLASFLSGFGFFTLMLLFVTQQIHLFVRVWLRVWFLASQSDLYSRYVPEPLGTGNLHLGLN